MADIRIADTSGSIDITSSATTDKTEVTDYSIWPAKLEITSFKSDPWRWNKEWEMALQTLSSEEVFSTMGLMYKRGQWNADELSEHVQELGKDVCRLQGVVMENWDNLEEKEHFITAWLLLAEKERKRHLLQGMDEACGNTSWNQDARALCPEITISSMLKQNGRAFIDFMNAYRNGKKGLREDTPYYLPNEWWEKTMDKVPQSVSEEFEESTFELLTLARSQFIGEFRW